VGIYFYKTGTPTFNVRIHIYTDTGSGPGSSVGVGGWVSASGVGGMYYFTGLSVALASGTAYWAVVETDVIHGDGSNNLAIQSDTGGGPPGGWYSSNDGSTWYNFGNSFRGTFEIYSSP
jgi:hypothetical protein